MKKLFLLSTFYFLLIPSFSQNVFNKIIEDENNDYPLGVLVDSVRYIIYENDDYKSRYTVLDTMGNIVVRKYISVYDSCSHYLTSNNALFRIHEDTLIAIGNLVNSNNKNSIFYYALNNNLDTLLSKTFLDNSGQMFVRDTKYEKEANKIIITGTISHNNTTDNSKTQAFTLKINTNGDSLQYKKYSSSYKTYARHITKTHDNGYILSGGRNAVGDDWNRRWNLIKLDSNLNYQWSHAFADYGYNSRWINGLIATEDGNYIAVGGIGYWTNFTGFTTYYNSRLIKFSADDNGLTILKDTTYTEPFFISDASYAYYPNAPGGDSLVSQSIFKTIKELPNGNFLVLVHYLYLDNNDERNGTKLYTLNSDLEIIKKQHFSSCYISGNTTEELNDIHLFEDGSLLLSGMKYNGMGNQPCSDNIQESWLIKTNIDYCDDFGSCDTDLRLEYITELPDSMCKGDTLIVEFRITGGRDNMEYGTYISVDDYKFSHVELYDAFWDTIMTDEVHTFSLYYTTEDTVKIDPSFVFVDHSQGAFYDLSFRIDPMVRFVENHEGIEEIENKNSFTVYPNPAQNNVQITINNEQLKNKAGEIKIYDIRAKLVKEFKTQNSKSIIQIDDLEKGIYFVQIGVGTQKLIIE